MCSIYVYMHMCIIYIYIYVKHVYICIDVNMYKCVYAHLYICMYICIYTYVHIFIHLHCARYFVPIHYGNKLSTSQWKGKGTKLKILSALIDPSKLVRLSWDVENQR